MWTPVMMVHTRGVNTTAAWAIRRASSHAVGIAERAEPVHATLTPHLIITYGTSQG